MPKLSQVYWEPKCSTVQKNPASANKTTPQAWSHKGSWFYNYTGALAEARFRWERLPTKDELLTMINSIPGGCIEKAKTLNIPFAGYRGAGLGEFFDKGVFACLWSSSPNNDDVSALYVYLHQDGDDAFDGWHVRGRGFLVCSISE